MDKVDEQIGDDTDAKEFYTDAAKYWEKVPATVDGMLGGFGFISKTDIEGSQNFLESLFIKVVYLNIIPFIYIIFMITICYLFQA